MDISRLLKVMPLMLALDADQDGSLSTVEIESAAASLKKLDKNGDGLVGPEELRPNLRDLMANRLPGPGRPGDKGPSALLSARVFQERDANGDGKLEGDEIPERLRQALARIDTNGDGAIDKAEAKRALEMKGDRPGQPKRGDDDGGAGVKPKRPDAN